MALICAALVCGTFFAAQHWKSQGWLLGLLAGAALTFWAIFRISPPPRIENWQSGAWGERDTARALKPLEREGWIVLHDLSARVGNIDHVVVGPTGVYLLDSKRLGGSVTVDDTGMTVRSIDDPDLAYHHTGTGHVLSLARQTHDQILDTSRINTWVTPVMVLWSPFPQRVVEQRCAYVHGDDLVGWLRARPQTIASARVQQVAEAARRAWTSGDRRPRPSLAPEPLVAGLKDGTRVAGRGVVSGARAWFQPRSARR
ncbi:MAG TPA: nuclease-related domain-containing protein [Nocardioides sp.]|uniref:nuclease-related domain-containing protein n=1 Tax=Nocardioides sp. TaxID=35761 RepID=UPI002E366B7B|nr:nuclease-related domain-containing protein [Nocardioides sp.]HEX3931945.1 nuclease-related domain-containing protein [Nocardioides sp.]